MDRYIGLDTGKHELKLTEIDKDTLCISRECSIRTKIGDGDFRDDAIEKQTVVAEYNGKVYKVGNGARGKAAAADTSKISEIHSICSLIGLACFCSKNETDTFHVATGIPVTEWANVSKRCDYKENLLPTGEITITIKKSSNDEKETKKFRIGERYVYPEGIGGVTQYDIWKKVKENPYVPTGCIDLGSLNVNISMYEGLEAILDKSDTATNGGNKLAEDIASALKTAFDECDYDTAINIMLQPRENRSLPGGVGFSEEQRAESKEIISRVISEYVEKYVYAFCKNHEWMINSTRLVAIGGTSKLIDEELISRFKNLTVLPNAKHCNSRAYAMIMCANSESFGLKEIVPLTVDEIIDRIVDGANNPDHADVLLINQFLGTFLDSKETRITAKVGDRKSDLTEAREKLIQSGLISSPS